MLEHLDIRNLAITNYQFLRRLINLMPLETLYFASLTNADLKYYSRIRIVPCLLVESGDPADEGYITYAEMMARSRLTPLFELTIHMRPHMNSFALVGKIEQKCYRYLCFHGVYHWRDVVDFLHPGLVLVKLFGRMEINTPREIWDFCTALAENEVRKCVFLTDGSEDDWFQSMACIAWNDIPGCENAYSCRTRWHYRVTRLLDDDVKLRLKFKEWVNPAPNVYLELCDKSVYSDYILHSEEDYGYFPPSYNANTGEWDEPPEADDDQNEVIELESDDDEDEDVDDLHVHDEMIELLDDVAEPENGMPDDPNDFEMDFFADDEAEPEDSGEETSEDEFAEMKKCMLSLTVYDTIN